MKKKVTEQDYIKACRRASRDAEIEMHGRPLHRKKVHKSKKAYSRKDNKAGLRDLPYLFSMA